MLQENSTVIYIDILLAINLAVNYFLLLSSLKLTGRTPKRRRLLFSSFIGSLYSLIILLPELPWFFQAMTRAVCCLLMILLCEWPVKRKEVFQDCLIFFIVSFIFAGFILALKIFLSPPVMIYANGIFYLKISALTLIISAISAYLITEVFRRIFRKKASITSLENGRTINVTIVFEGRTIQTEGFVDTGNTLTDPLSGTPVVIIGSHIAQKLLSSEKFSALHSPLSNAGILGAGTRSGFRLVPYNTVSGSGLLPVFRPESFHLYHNGNCYHANDVLIGFSPQNDLCGNHPIIINPELLLQTISKKNLNTKEPVH